MTPAEAELAYKLSVARLERGDSPATQDEDLALLQQAAEAGYAPAQFAYGNALDYIRGDIPAALPWFLAAARQGYADAHHRLRELYAHRKAVRARMGELMTAEELSRMQLREANFIVWFFGREEGYNSHFGRFCAMLIGLAIACPLAWYNLVDLAAGLDGLRPWRVLWEGMLIRQAGVYFGLNFFAASLVDWLKPGSTANSMLLAITMSLLLLHIAFSLALWGGYELCHNAQLEEYWWLPGGGAAFAGVLLAVLYLLQLARWFASQKR